MQIDIIEIIWNKPPWFRLTLQLFSSIEIHPLKMTFGYLSIKSFDTFDLVIFVVVRKILTWNKGQVKPEVNRKFNRKMNKLGCNDSIFDPIIIHSL